jgi:hypothetical protein
MDKEIRNGSESKNIPKILSECFLVLSEHYADLSDVNAPWEVSFRIG